MKVEQKDSAVCGLTLSLSPNPKMDTHTSATATLHSCTVHRGRAIASRLHMFFHFAAVLVLLHYRLSHLLLPDAAVPVPHLSWSLMTVAELLFTFIWVLSQGFRWVPVTRSVHPENLNPGRAGLPGVDVFICTADPEKEPTVEVMNTVLSAMALDYPAERLAVYLSDDGGSDLTRLGIGEACGFARVWLPFVRRFGVKTRSPEMYFSSLGDDERVLRGGDEEFKAEEEQIKTAYQQFKENVERASGHNRTKDHVVHDRAPCIEVIHDDSTDGWNNEDPLAKMPLLVYVSREVRPTHPHRFKAGALNTLLRVSGIMSNGPYILVLDCDMFCNDPTSARQAMCFHLDPKLSRSLSFVQFPQMFYNLAKNDIYDGQARPAYKTKWQGMDGLRGPVFTGTGYYLQKKALYGSPNQDDKFLLELEKSFGHSSKFITSLKSSNEQDHTNRKRTISDETLEEAKRLASCSFEENTKWGKEIGYTYVSMLESTFTGYFLHCKGWKSVYLYPKTPGFLGCTPIDMKDALIQLMKWSSGCVQVGLSRFSPLVYGMSRMPILQSLCYGYFTFFPITCIPVLIYAMVPQLCLVNDISLFPKVSDPWFAVFAVVYASSLGQHLYEVLSSNGTIREMWNEQRKWMITTVTAIFFGCTDAFMKVVWKKKVKFSLTNKAIDKEKLEKYKKGKFNFDGAAMFVLPLATLIILNTVCLIAGLRGVIKQGNFGEMFGQIFISAVVVLLGFSIFEGLIPSKRK